jgi:uncharacterized protein (DUF305 family)
MSMSTRARLIAALSASGMAGMVLSAFVLLLAAPAPSRASMAAAQDATHDHTGAAAMCRAPQGPTFYSEMTTVNARMHEGMDVVPSGDVDRDFARMMIPHHQGAIDMALLQLKYGHDEKLRRLAQSIIVEQGQEIAYMRNLLDRPHNETSSLDRIADK